MSSHAQCPMAMPAVDITLTSSRTEVWGVPVGCPDRFRVRAVPSTNILNPFRVGAVPFPDILNPFRVGAVPFPNILNPFRVGAVPFTNILNPLGWGRVL